MQLTTAQKKEFFDNGYIQLRGMIPPEMINMALRTINHSLGKGMDVRKMPEFRAGSYCPELRNHPGVTDLLFKAPVMSVAESLTQPGKIQLWGGAQIALRFPVMESPGEYHPHIDGMYRPGNKIRKGKMLSFTLLAGVLLSNTVNRYWGNFTVWPGTHRMLEEYFRSNDPASTSGNLPPIALPDPVQITGSAGDVILCHYQTVHTAAANVSPYIRYAVFFRLIHVEHSAHEAEAFRNIWLEWPALKASLQ